MQKFGVNNMLSTLFDTHKFADELVDKVITAIEEERESNRPENLLKILEYLPEQFDDKSEEEYIEAIASALLTSYDNGLYQFAFMQEHMLFMTAIYFVLLKIYHLHKDETSKALYYLLKDRRSEFFSKTNTKNGDLFFGSFAAISESDVFMLLKVVGMDDSLHSDLKDFVKERNDYAHANGRLMLTSDELFAKKVNEYALKIEKVFSLIRSDIENLYINIITCEDFYNPDVRAYYDPDEQIVEEFIRHYSLSRVELNWLRKIKTSNFKKYDGYEHIKDLHIALCHYYTVLVQDDENYHTIEDIYYHHKYQDKADEFVEKELGISGYECVKDGGEFPVYDCPECGQDQLVYDAEADKYHCFHCSQDYEGGELMHCSDCPAIAPVNEVGLCSNCIQRKMED